ncbi:uncharacterized protein JCM10292_000515 [Rhodotorula paludigena]|uniref:uncharacterized protein n=1 Tax=Rhodotorula paludigena TaxID=86838 RepID=UPI003177E123
MHPVLLQPPTLHPSVAPAFNSVSAIPKDQQRDRLALELKAIVYPIALNRLATRRYRLSVNRLLLEDGGRKFRHLWLAGTSGSSAAYQLARLNGKHVTLDQLAALPTLDSSFASYGAYARLTFFSARRRRASDIQFVLDLASEYIGTGGVVEGSKAGIERRGLSGNRPAEPRPAGSGTAAPLSATRNLDFVRYDIPLVALGQQRLELEGVDPSAFSLACELIADAIVWAGTAGAGGPVRLPLRPSSLRYSSAAGAAGRWAGEGAKGKEEREQEEEAMEEAGRRLAALSAAAVKAKFRSANSILPCICTLAAGSLTLSLDGVSELAMSSEGGNLFAGVGARRRFPWPNGPYAARFQAQGGAQDWLLDVGSTTTPLTKCNFWQRSQPLLECLSV